MKLEGMLGLSTLVRFRNKLIVRLGAHFVNTEITELELPSGTWKVADFILLKWKVNWIDTSKPILWWILPLISRDYGKVLYNNKNRAEPRTSQRAVAAALECRGQKGNP